ncbi:uncharacterized protein LOC120272458 [Dioscorea cayenensis subsp. rotundata]|uniref:Uncharacterized protein LOC120272458 n=1 Tax=Dioscorea cayennensis subsp. rotundata TaxID=55577 RepID=A0AB40C5X9_DIOCR|nr:uncharacterized protein LOC120272458 [Dioscorea cayenensis subsp. rotundata]
MDTGESQHRGRGQNKHYWTIEEDKALIEALVELSIDAMWRSENGFRNGYLFQLERMIKAKIPRTTLKAMPNIESRVKLLRRQTTAIADLLCISGFVWNHENSTIECEKSSYDEYVKNHKEAAGLYGKSFPFFNELAPVFTKDRAHGNARGDLGDDATQYMHENTSFEENTGPSQLPSDDFFAFMQEPIDPSSPMTSENNASSTSKRRKKKGLANDTSLEVISEKIAQFVEVVGPGLKAIADCAVRNAETVALMEASRKEADEKKKEFEERKRLLNEVVFNIDGLSEDDALVVIQFLRKDENELDMFWDLPNDKKLRFCRLILARMSFHPPNM